MRAGAIVRRLCGRCLSEVHVARGRAVLAAAEAITVARRLTLTTIGRAVRRPTSPRHRIKMIDRLLGSAALHRERHRWFASIAASLVGGQRRVVVLADWTQVHDDVWALVAAVPFRGRSLPILVHCHPKRRVGCRSAQLEFLRALRAVLPAAARAIVVTDAGFRSPFFNACEELGIDFVIRLRNDRAVASCRHDSERIPFADLYKMAGDRAQCLGDARPYASSQHSRLHRLVLGPRPAKAHRRSRYVHDYERKRGCEPLLLATSLSNDSAAAIVAIYERRMQIEQVFRDTKSSRLGWALEHAGSSTPRRLDILLLLAAIAFAAVVLVGAAATAAGLEKSLRASSLRTRVLSFFTVGNLLINDASLPGVRLNAIWKQLHDIRAELRALLPRVPPPTSQGRAVRLPLSHGLFCFDCGWQGARFGWPA